MTLEADPNASNTVSAEVITDEFSAFTLGVNANLQQHTTVVASSNADIDYCVKSDDSGLTILPVDLLSLVQVKIDASAPIDYKISDRNTFIDLLLPDLDDICLHVGTDNSSTSINNYHVTGKNKILELVIRFVFFEINSGLNKANVKGLEIDLLKNYAAVLADTDATTAYAAAKTEFKDAITNDTTFNVNSSGKLGLVAKLLDDIINAARVLDTDFQADIASNASSFFEPSLSIELFVKFVLNFNLTTVKYNGSSVPTSCSVAVFNCINTAS